MTFEVTLKATISNVIDAETFRGIYHDNAKAMLLDLFDGPMDLAINADEISIIDAGPLP